MGATRPRTPRASRPRAPRSWAATGTACPTSSRELEPTHGRARGAPPTSQIPTLRSLQRAAPELERFLDARPSRSRARSRGSITALGEAADAGHERAARVKRGDRRAARAGGVRAPAGQAAAPVPPDDRRPQALDRERPAGRGPGAAGARQDRLQGRPGLHRHGGALELRLLPDARHQRASTSSATCCGSSPFTGGPCPPYSAKPDRGRDQGVQLLARPQPARRDHARARPRPARRRASRAEREPGRRRAPSASARAARASAAAPPDARQARPVASRRSSCPTRSRSCSTASARRLPKDTPAARSTAAAGRRATPTSSSTTCSRHDPPPRHPALVASPVLVGAVTVLVAMHLGLPRLQRQHRAAVRAHLRREGRDPRRLEPGGGQRGAHRRLPGRRGGADPARHRRAPGERAERPGRRAAGDRGGRHEARQAGRAAAGGHAPADPPALGAGPEVHLADARPQLGETFARRRHDPARSSRSSRSSSTSSSTSRTTSSARTCARCSRATARRWPGRGAGHQRGDRGPGPVPRATSSR